MWVATKVSIGFNRSCFGPGTRELLSNIEEYGSIRQAALEMNLSYNKALRLIRRMEEELGFPVVVSEKGGNAHGGTFLSKKGRLVLDAYLEIEQEVSALAERLATEKFLHLRAEKQE